MIPYFEVPELALGAVRIQVYGVLVVLGWLVGLGITLARADREQRRLWIPAALFVIVPLWTAAPARFWSVMAYGGGDLSALGFVLAVVPLAVLWFAYWTPERVWTQLDAATTGLVYAWAMGRLGCFLVHDHPGEPTLFPLAVRGICANNSRGVACHDLGLYELLASLAWLVGLQFLRDKGAGAGISVSATAIAYGVWRLLADFLRTEDPRTLGLTPTQWFAPLLITAGLVGIAAAGVVREARITEQHP